MYIFFLLAQEMETDSIQCVRTQFIISNQDLGMQNIV
jgi:hypothetical protein